MSCWKPKIQIFCDSLLTSPEESLFLNCCDVANVTLMGCELFIILNFKCFKKSVPYYICSFFEFHRALLTNFQKISIFFANISKVSQCPFPRNFVVKYIFNLRMEDALPPEATTTEKQEPGGSMSTASKRKKSKGRNGNIYIGVINRIEWMKLQNQFGFKSVNNFGTFVLETMRRVHG